MLTGACRTLIQPNLPSFAASRPHTRPRPPAPPRARHNALCVPVSCGVSPQAPGVARSTTPTMPKLDKKGKSKLTGARKRLTTDLKKWVGLHSSSHALRPLPPPPTLSLLPAVIAAHSASVTRIMHSAPTAVPVDAGERVDLVRAPCLRHILLFHNPTPHMPRLRSTSQPVFLRASPTDCRPSHPPGSAQSRRPMTSCCGTPSSLGRMQLRH